MLNGECCLIIAWQAKETQEKHKETKLMRMLATGTNQGLLSQEEQSAYVAKLRAEAAKGSISESMDAKALATDGTWNFNLICPF